MNEDKIVILYASEGPTLKNLSILSVGEDVNPLVGA